MKTHSSICAMLLLCTSWAVADRLPNIVLILADDLGYGDVSCYNPESKVPTPNIDALAERGLQFADAHSPSTVCTPTRYSLMTGRMAFRTGMRGVFAGAGGPCLIEEGRLTLPQMLHDAGYTTALTGKWHVGLTFFDAEGKPINDSGLDAVRRIDFTRPIPDGPVNRGFDRFFGTACCPTTDWLYAFIVGDRVPTPPTGILDKSGLPNHAYAQDMRPGLIAPDFDMEKTDLLFLRKSQAFLEEQARERPDRPFFLFHSTQAVHLPSLAADRFKGKSGAGPHGDFILELDYVVGELIATLDRLGFAENTLVLFTSDNGPETTSVVNMRTDHGHDGARPWRGMKRDQWEGGHRVPLIACWPGRVAAGTRSDQTVCLTDIMATCATIAGVQLPNEAAEDSFDFSGVLAGTQGSTPVREYTLHQTISLDLAIRKGPWKYLDHQGSGGNNYDTGKLLPYRMEDSAPDAPGQLYNLEDDPGETENLYFQQPELVAALKDRLEEFKRSGRSVPERKPIAPSILGHVVDADTGAPLPARVYVHNTDSGEWHFVEVMESGGSAVVYDVQRGQSIEKHTTISAHPFRVALPPGTYEITAERGKEYFAATKRVDVREGVTEVTLPLQRWINMASEGWYSGETHVHRALAELPNVMLAEDLNVAFPLSYWVREDDKPPMIDSNATATPPAPELVKIDATHVFYPLNTEYEIFETAGRQHTLGAVFILNQKTPIPERVPPVAPILQQVRREDALLELDKHNWPWSMMLVPTLAVDLYELSNNHLWRTDFLFKRFSEAAPAYMNVETDEAGFTEDGWIQFGFENYYTLLNCGFRMRPTAGTASGVHPVPLGFGRVYVYLPDGFSYDAWVDGLDAGQSFVTTGPMLVATLDGAEPGRHVQMASGAHRIVSMRLRVASPYPVNRLDVVVNGEVVPCEIPASEANARGVYEFSVTREIAVNGTSWIAARSYAKTSEGRTRFAHTAPWHIDIEGQPLRPRKEEVAYLIGRMNDEIKRNTGVLGQEALDEYRRALEYYENLMPTAR